MTYTFTADTWTIMGCRWTRHLPVFRGQRRRASFRFKQWCLFLIRYLGLRICTWSRGGGEMLSTPLCRRQWENCSCPPPAAALRENRPCIPPGQHNGANSVVWGVGEPVPKLWGELSPLRLCHASVVGWKMPPYPSPLTACHRWGSRLSSLPTVELRKADPPPWLNSVVELTLLAEVQVS